MSPTQLVGGVRYPQHRQAQLPETWQFEQLGSLVAFQGHA